MQDRIDAIERATESIEWPTYLSKLIVEFIVHTKLETLVEYIDNEMSESTITNLRQGFIMKVIFSEDLIFLKCNKPNYKSCNRLLKEKGIWVVTSPGTLEIYKNTALHEAPWSDYVFRSYVTFTPQNGQQTKEHSIIIRKQNLRINLS